ncbi:hypothetical protein HOP50_01g06210 [Chloropicon primus]|nr:hypothetical protein HOP50_01g06210 [Chloropicon primus]
MFFLARKSQIDSLTSTKDEPTPIYGLQELAKLVSSDSSSVDSVASYLCTTRLAHKSPVVKQKVLKAIKYVASKPECSSFRSAVQQNAGALREHANFSCAADPLKGNRPAELVRQAAKEAIHAIYSTDSSWDGSGGSRTQAMQGFGTGVSTSHGSDNAESARSSSSSSGFNRGGRDRSGSGGFGVKLSWGRSNGNDTAPQFASSPAHSPRGFGEGEPSNNNNQRGAWGASLEPQGAPVPISSYSSNQQPSSSESSIHRMEAILDKICLRKGMKLQPPAEEVKKYVSAAQDVHIEDLWLTLKIKLSHEPWQQQYIGLCLLQALLGCHNKTFGQAVRDQAGKDSGCVQNLCSAQNATLSTKAKNVLSKLNRGQAQHAARGAQGHPNPQPQPQPQGVPQPDLLDLGLGAPAAPGQPQGQADLLQGLEVVAGGGQSQAAAPAAAPASDLFAGLSVSNNDGPQKQSQGGGLANAAAPPAVQQQGAGAGGLFDGLDMNQQGPAKTGPAPVQADLFGGADAAVQQNTTRPPMSPPPMSPPPAMPPPQGMMPLSQGMMPPSQGMMPQAMPGMNMNPMMQQQMMQQQMMLQQQMMMQQQQRQMMMQPQMYQPMGGMHTGMGMGMGGMTHPAGPKLGSNHTSPTGAMSAARNSTMIDGRARPEPAFDFVQDLLKK